MGLLQEGKWVDQWYDTKSTNGRFVRKPHSFAIGLRPMERQGQAEKAALKPSQDVIIFMFLWLAPGPTGL